MEGGETILSQQIDILQSFWLSLTTNNSTQSNYQYTEVKVRKVLGQLFFN